MPGTRPMPSDATTRWLSPEPSRVRQHQLRQRLTKPDVLIAPGADNGMTARLIGAAGFLAVHMIGSGVAKSLTGKAGCGSGDANGNRHDGAFLVQATGVPVICDVDDGYSNAINLIRIVQEFKRPGRQPCRSIFLRACTPTEQSMRSSTSRRSTATQSRTVTRSRASGRCALSRRDISIPTRPRRATPRAKAINRPFRRSDDNSARGAR